MTWGEGTETWYETGKIDAPVGEATGFGWAVSEYGGLYAVGSPVCDSSCTTGGTVSVFESSTLLQTVHNLLQYMFNSCVCLN